MRSSELVGLLSRQLNDQQLKVYRPAHLLDYLNDGLNRVVATYPMALSVEVSVDAQDGIKQSLPAEAMLFMGVQTSELEGETIAVRMADMATKDAFSPAWRGAPAGQVREYLFDDASPRQFSVWPRPQLPQTLQIKYAKYPDKFLSLGKNEAATTDLPEEYGDAVCEWALYRIFSEDNDGQSLTKAQSHYGAFGQLLGGRQQTDGSLPIASKKDLT